MCCTKAFFLHTLQRCQTNKVYNTMPSMLHTLYSCFAYQLKVIRKWLLTKYFLTLSSLKSFDIFNLESWTIWGKIWIFWLQQLNFYISKSVTSWFNYLYRLIIPLFNFFWNGQTNVQFFCEVVDISNHSKEATFNTHWKKLVILKIYQFNCSNPNIQIFPQG